MQKFNEPHALNVYMTIVCILTELRFIWFRDVKYIMYKLTLTTHLCICIFDRVVAGMAT